MTFRARMASGRLWVALVLCTALWSLSTLNVEAQTGTTESIEFRDPSSVFGVQMMPFPRSFALGEAGVALRDPSALVLNPAGIGRDGYVVAGVNVGTDHILASEGSFGMDWVSAGAASVQIHPRWAVGALFQQSSFGTLEVRDGTGMPLQPVESFDRKVAATGAYHVTSNWSVGVGLGVIQQKIAGETGASPSVDLGVQGHWTIDRRSVRIEPSAGWSLMNVGPALNFEEFDAPLPMTMRLGGATRIATQDTWMGRPVFAATVLAQFSKNLAGGTFEVQQQNGRGRRVDVNTRGPLKALFGNWGSATGRDGERASAWEQIERHVGAEMSVYGIGSVRVGRRSTDSDYALQSYTAVGVGLDLVYAEIDYSVAVSDDEQAEFLFGGFEDLSYVRVTVPIPLSGKYENNWWGRLTD